MHIEQCEQSGCVGKAKREGQITQEIHMLGAAIDNAEEEISRLLDSLSVAMSYRPSVPTDTKRPAAEMPEKDSSAPLAQAIRAAREKIVKITNIINDARDRIEL